MSFVSSSHILDFCRGLDSERRVSCQAIHYWTEVKGHDRLPRLKAINFTDVPELRDNLFTVATGNGGGRFIVLSYGKVLRDVCGEDPRGQTLYEALPEPLNGSAVECCVTAIDTHQPMIGAGTLILENNREIMYRMIILPLSDDGKAVDHLIGALSFRVME
ncbi:MAG: hypothetical protein A3G18_11445 [Rhodospirillales bacterium RIFCSPLOWO2_12_FULL_58_28]|nr:MAG: hypothetical protein A3H92_10590 [Rhodospirillales bacterium RIFCSPLOWO2_02_FULL_58_16]OHC77797.1 MAG: hypothetical protein A3G18_11445 [Rhodospirillales bacterium RIFCSPLOWO2_12_FULL_58_28]